jgi:FkbM family methyltransferase
MPAELGAAWFRCSPLDHISRDVYFTGRYEPQETAMLRDLLRPGMTFVDVGANWGYFTLLAAGCVGPAGRIVSLEPDPRLFPLLRANIARNGYTGVVARQVAASDRRGAASFAGFDDQSEQWGLSHLTGEAGEGMFKVVTCPVDALLDELRIDSVDLLKMDIEGAEELALLGMKEGLARHRYQRILLEVHPGLLFERGRTVADVLEYLRAAGYRGWEIDHAAEVTRRLSYAKKIEANDLLRPAMNDTREREWPHMLWVAPQVEVIEAIQQ